MECRQGPPARRARCTLPESTATESCLCQCSATLRQPRRQLVIDAVKSAIGEDRNHIAGLKLPVQLIDNCGDISAKLSWRSCGIERGDHLLRMQPLRLGNALLLIDRSEDHA